MRVVDSAPQLQEEVAASAERMVELAGLPTVMVAVSPRLPALAAAVETLDGVRQEGHRQDPNSV